MTELTAADAARVRGDLVSLGYWTDHGDTFAYRDLLQACYDHVKEHDYAALTSSVIRRLALETGVLGRCQWADQGPYGTLLCGDQVDEAADDRLPFCTRHRYLVLSEAS